MKVDRGHWVGRKPDYIKYFGFIYEITNLLNGRIYIGKKQYHKYKKNTYVRKGESDWRKYTGSSKELNEDIKKYGKENFKFRILKNTPNRLMHTYMEIKEIMKRDAILKENEDKFYNVQIERIRTRPSNKLMNGVKRGDYDI